MSRRQAIENIRRSSSSDRFDFSSNQSVSESDHVVTDIDGGCETELLMHGRDTVSEGISIFDVIVNERSFVETLNAHRGAFDPMRKT